MPPPSPHYRRFKKKLMSNWFNRRMENSRHGSEDQVALTYIKTYNPHCEPNLNDKFGGFEVLLQITTLSPRKVILSFVQW